jgi:hypothetical protein
MTHDELLELIKPMTNNDAIFMKDALRAVVEYSKELSQTDYRGNPPVEHHISAKLIQIIEKELE